MGIQAFVRSIRPALHPALGTASVALMAFRRLAESAGGEGFVRVLTYHDVLGSEIEDFARQIEFLSRRYRWVDFTEFKQMISGQAPIRGGNLLLTFDDGFRSNFEITERILNPRGIQALFFIPGGFIDCVTPEARHQYVTRHLRIEDQGSAPMSWRELESLVRAGHTVGSHTLSHRRLPEIASDSELELELRESAQILHQKLGIEPEALAYPFGDVGSIDARALTMARRHYRYVFSGVRGNNSGHTSPLALRRDAVSPRDPLPYLRMIVEGGLSPYYRSARRKLDQAAQKTLA